MSDTQFSATSNSISGSIDLDSFSGLLAYATPINLLAFCLALTAIVYFTCGPSTQKTRGRIKAGGNVVISQESSSTWLGGIFNRTQQENEREITTSKSVDIRQRR